LQTDWPSIYITTRKKLFGDQFLVTK